MSLILNAKDAMPEGGTLTLTTKVDGGRALIACTDSGRGIDAQDMPHVFDAFYTTKDHGLGAWLGLYVCHSIVDEHDGHITIDSNPGGGTTVTVDLAAERVHVMSMSMTVGAGSPRRAPHRFTEQSDEMVPIIELPVQQVGGKR